LILRLRSIFLLLIVLIFLLQIHTFWLFFHLLLLSSACRRGLFGLLLGVLIALIARLWPQTGFLQLRLKLINLCFEFPDVFHQLPVLISFFVELLHLLFQFLLNVQLRLVSPFRFGACSLDLLSLPLRIILPLVGLGKSFLQLRLLGMRQVLDVGLCVSKGLLKAAE